MRYIKKNHYKSSPSVIFKIIYEKSKYKIRHKVKQNKMNNKECMRWGDSETLNQWKEMFIDLEFKHRFIGKAQHLYCSLRDIPPNLNKDFITDSKDLIFLVDTIESSQTDNLKIMCQAIEIRLGKYLTNQYINTIEQDIATLIFCNIYYVGGVDPPSNQLVEEMIKLLKHGSDKTKTNCIGFIQNAANDHHEWVNDAISKYQLIQALCQPFKIKGKIKSQQCWPLYLFKAMTSIVLSFQRSNINESLTDLFPILTDYLINLPPKNRENIRQLLENQRTLSQALTCFYYLSELLPQAASNHLKNVKSLGFRWFRLVTWFQFNLFAITSTLLIHANIMQYRSPEDYMIYLGTMVSKGDFHIKKFTYLMIIDAIKSSKLSSLQVAGEKNFIAQLEKETKLELLYYLIQIYSDAMSHANAIKKSFGARVRQSLKRITEQNADELQLIEKVKETWSNLDRLMDLVKQ